MTEPPISAHLGVDNSEIMEEAVAYDAFLLGTVTARVRDVFARTASCWIFGAGPVSLAHPSPPGGAE